MTKALAWLGALALFAVTALTTAGPAAAAPETGLSLSPLAADTGFESLTPARLLDSRPGGPTVDGAFSGFGALSTSARVDLTVLGRGGVPATGVDAVVLNVTVDQPTAVGYVTVWPTGEAQPNASNLNFTPGRTVPNLVVAKVGAAGRVSLFNSAGDTQLLVDVVGFAKTSGLTPLVPARVLDTRAGGATIDGAFAGGGAVGGDGRLDLTVLGRGGLPGTGVDSVILNVTVNEPTAEGYVTVWPNGAAQPNASNINFTPGLTVPNLVVAKVGAGGAVSIFNSLGDTHFIVDVVGYFTAGAAFQGLQPARLLDTRDGGTTIDGIGASAGALPGGEEGRLRVIGRGGVPATDVGAVMLNVTVTQPTAVGYITVWPAQADQPNASNLNFTPGQTVANLVLARVGAGGNVDLFNSAGDTHLIVDVVGWVPAEDPMLLVDVDLTAGLEGQPYSEPIGVVNGQLPLTFGASGLQPGLSIDPSTAVVSGTPTTPGTVSSAVTVTDGFGRATSDDISHTVFPAGSGFVPMVRKTVLQASQPLPDESFSIDVTGAGVPTDARGVVLSVFAASTTSGWLTLYPSGGFEPMASSMTYDAGINSNLAVVAPGAGGSVALTNHFGTPLGVVVEVMGYFDAASTFEAVSPERVLDTRTTTKLAAGASTSPVTSGSFPVGAAYAIVNVIETDAEGPGSLTPTGATIPTMRWRDTTARTKFVLVPLSGNSFSLTNTGASATNVIVDVWGYITA